MKMGMDHVTKKVYRFIFHFKPNYLFILKYFLIQSCGLLEAGFTKKGKSPENAKMTANLHLIQYDKYYGPLSLR